MKNNKKVAIVVCSKNKAKNNAVNNVIKDFFDNYEIKSLETNSSVSETPMSNDEGIKGCINRINDAIKQDSNADLYIAMEGILNRNDYGTFLCGWTVIYDKKTEEYSYGCSAQIKVPDKIIENLDKNTRLSKKVAEYTNSTDEIISEIGTNGMLTNGCYTRTDEFTDSILCAVSSKYKKLIKTK